MKTAGTVCEKCGATISGHSTRQICPACLLQAGLGLLQNQFAPAAFDPSQDDGRRAAVASGGADDRVPDSTGPSDDHFGVYEIERHPDGSLKELGRGAMGVTYCAIDTSLQRKVALKIIKAGIATGSADACERFMREARAAASLRHENIATVYQFGVREDTGQYFYAMELIEGETLDERIHRAGPLDVRATVDIAQQVTGALAVAEKHGLVHRDLKPANLMLVSPEDETAGNNEKVRVKIIDFGLAKALRAQVDPLSLTRGGFVGTPEFASPEQFEHAALDVRSDIYSLGATLWFALTGRTPFVGHRVEEIHESQKSDALPMEQLKAARVPSRLKSLLSSMLALEPASRPSTHDLAARLQLCSAEARRQRHTRFALAAATVLVLGVFTFLAFRPVRVQNSAANLNVPEKSIAVLPFENRSEDKANAYFADSIQDEILTRLSKIADLKVISRTSTQQYKSARQNLSEIAKQLGVAHILEGSVQKSGDSVRVNVQLIKAANDSHVWADTIDRKLTDILSVESEIARAVADQLRATLTGHEEQLIAAKPTNNPEAYDAYLRGLAYTLKTEDTPEQYLGAQKYLKEAVRLDPKFALAWAMLSYTDAVGYQLRTLQPTDALREEARQAAETALSLQPNLGEALMAMGYYYYACLKDYDTATRYLEKARQLLPNNSQVPESLAYVARRRGQWDLSETYFNEAERLNGRDPNLLREHAFLYMYVRRFPEALRKFDQVLNITPDDMGILSMKAAIAQAEGDLPRAAALLKPPHPNADDSAALGRQIHQAILERNPVQIIPRVKQELAKLDTTPGYQAGALRFWLGWLQELAGNHDAALATWQQTRNELESFLKEQPENWQVVGTLALTDMGLGDKAAAFDLLERAMAALPVEKDAVDGPVLIQTLAQVAARMGEPDRAIAALRRAISLPSRAQPPFTPALLRLDPMWDPLRGDPRFQELCKDKQP
jgi:serine/threonine protein kinase/Tfp pilus assembly protein PilF